MSRGNVALMYLDGPANDPQVWFQDLTADWHFVAKNFRDYARLLLMYMGLPNWLFVFTPTNLDPVTMAWYRRLSPPAPHGGQRREARTDEKDRDRERGRERGQRATRSARKRRM